MCMRAGDECVAAFDLVHQPMRQEEVERAIYGDRRRAWAVGGHALDDFIGTSSLVALRHTVEHVSALRRQLRPAALTDALGPPHQIGSAMIMIVTGIGEGHPCYIITIQPIFKPGYLRANVAPPSRTPQASRGSGDGRNGRFRHTAHAG